MIGDFDFDFCNKKCECTHGLSGFFEEPLG
jgi:hypothetical protein